MLISRAPPNKMIGDVAAVLFHSGHSVVCSDPLPRIETQWQIGRVDMIMRWRADRRIHRHEGRSLGRQDAKQATTATAATSNKEQGKRRR